MHTSTFLSLLASLPFILPNPIPVPAPSPATCTPPSTIPLDISAFRPQVDGSAEGMPELQIAWENPQFPESPGHFVLSDTPMTEPILSFLNGNDGGKLCDLGDLCSDLDKKSGKDQFQGFSFNGRDQNAKPAFEVVGICDSEGEAVYALKPRDDSGNSPVNTTPN